MIESMIACASAQRQNGKPAHNHIVHTITKLPFKVIEENATTLKVEVAKKDVYIDNPEQAMYAIETLLYYADYIREFFGESLSPEEQKLNYAIMEEQND